MKINLNKIITQYLLAALGFILISYYIWFRFIRERLPRDIPFQLTIFNFILIGVICGVYLYIIYRYFKPINVSSSMIDVLRRLSKIFLPFIIFDNLLKSEKNIQKFFEQLLNALSSYFYKKHLFTFNNSYKFYLIITILPKVIMLLSFIIDIFYFHKLTLVYLCMLVGIIPLLKTYILFSIRKLVEKDIQYIEYNYYIQIIDEEAPEDGCITMKDFLEYQTDAIRWGDLQYKYQCIETWNARQEYANKHNIPLSDLYVFLPNYDNISKALATNFYELIPKIIHMQAFLVSDHTITSLQQIKKINIIIISIYLFCWFYILIISSHTHQDMSLICKILELMVQYSVIEEPFSNTFLEYYENKFK